MLYTPIKGIIFDVDGTISNSPQFQYEWLKIAADTFEGTFKWDKFCPKFLIEYNDAYENFGMKGLYELIGVDFEKHAKQIWDDFTRYNRTREIPPVTGVVPAIKEIYKRSRVHGSRTMALRMALNTTKTMHDIDISMKKAGLLELMDCVVTKDDVYKFVTNGEAKKKGISLDDYAALKTILPEQIVKSLEKPNGYAAMLTSYRLGVNPSRIIAFEDTKTGIDSYRGVMFPDGPHNIAVAAVTWGYESEEKLRRSNPDYIINKPKDMVQLIGDLGGLN